MRLTAAVTLLLFLTPTFYVVKYYAVDLPRETLLASPHPWGWRLEPYNADYLLAEGRTASRLPVKRSAEDQEYRILAIRAMGTTLRRRGMGWKRPLESISGKATLAELASKDKDPAVKSAAAEELEKIALGGAVIRR